MSGQLTVTPATGVTANRAIATLSLCLLAALIGVPWVVNAAPLGVKVSEPWCRATTPNASTGGCYMRLQNTSDHAVRLLGASSPAAGMTQLHRSVETDGNVKMVHQENGVAVPSGGQVRFAPGGYHVMLMKLKGRLAKGDTVAVTLEYQGGSEQRIDFPVRSLTYQADDTGGS